MDTLAKIRERRSAITKMIDALTTEDSDLAIAERVVARLEAVPHPALKPSAAIPAPSQMSHPDLIVATLRVLQNSWVENWSDLQGAIRALHGVEIPKSSLQPYLSNLKAKDVIVRDGPRIALAERVKKGAGSMSDNSYDPNVARNEDDEDQPRLVMMRSAFTDDARG